MFDGLPCFVFFQLPENFLPTIVYGWPCSVFDVILNSPVTFVFIEVSFFFQFLNKIAKCHIHHW